MLLASIVGILVAAAMAPLLQRTVGRHAGRILSLVPASLTIAFALNLRQIAEGGAVVTSMPWVPTLGIDLSFRLDGLSMLFALLICSIGFLVILYAGSYMRDDPRLGRFYAYLLLFKASMLGLVLADNLVLLFVFWELTSVSSYLLIGHHNKEKPSRDAALQALLVTGLGGMALLLGIIVTWAALGTLSLTELLQGPGLQTQAWYVPIALLFMLAAFTKSAQVPFHFWLPNAMKAPTPVSAFLHSATMVKAGVYLLARTSPLLGGTDLWTLSLKIVGASTMLLGAWLSLRSRDMKRILAYSTMSALGTLVLLLGVGTDRSVEAAIVLLFAHAMYKGSLFLIAGAVDHETGIRDVDMLGGLYRRMPILASAAMLAAASLAGLGPVFSFIGKELLLEAVLYAHFARPILMVATMVTGMFLVAIAFIVGVRPFVGPARATPKDAAEPPFEMLLGPTLLAGAGVAFAFVPGIVETWLLRAASGAVLGEPNVLKLTLWHGLTPALSISLIILLGGVATYHAWRFVHLRTAASRLSALGPQALYGHILRAIETGAKGIATAIQHGFLRHHVAVMATAIIATLVYVTLVTPLSVVHSHVDVQPHEALLAAVILAAALAVVAVHRRLESVVLLGIVGYGIALVFVLFGAPDLAMTQFIFETLTLLLFVLVLARLAPAARRSSRRVRVRDAVIATVFGTLMATVVLAVLAAPARETVSDFFGQTSYVVAHGRNVVNVVLVDFRALDTLGEITVLAAAAVGVYAMLRSARKGRDDA